MTERAAQLDTFLKRAGWGDARRAALAGDASNRRYLRLTRPQDGARSVLMDAPGEKGEDVRPFLRIAAYLHSLDLSAPAILAQDEEAGFLLLEDLGDDLFARVVLGDPDLEAPLYEAAILLLAQLHTHAPPEGLGAYDAPLASDLAALAMDWYVPGLDETATPQDRAALVRLMQNAIATHAPDCDVLIQRDYHAENLLWLPNRQGIARVGLLDFQDALCGHRAYDLVSLLQDARRDVCAATEQAMTALYVTRTGQDPDRFAAACATWGVQRNLRILGVFARLCLRDGKPHYVDLIPRVWGHLQRDLTHPALGSLRDLIARTLPAPTSAALEGLKARCATHPMP